ncbi:MAG: UDP-N-acetylglucosamine 2-epimerase (non-hydrolyzing), partial [Defluviitaleaceae bacterium]|nr:UDP-N-acetylglucosamine 2-epimerase (non-hydrolyzing) [Defluviitaleaceae bacterium]
MTANTSSTISPTPLKILLIFGTRPEATKLAPLYLELKRRENIRPIVAVTGQHREQLDQVLNLFGIKPDFDLNIMKARQSLFYIVSAALTGLEAVLDEARPDMVLVHGDTATTWTGAVAAFFKKIKSGHVEAGLRSFNKYEPFPEEVNRKLVTAVTDMYFAPTRLSKQNLLNEGVPEKSIYVTGNTAIDLLKYTIRQNYRFSENKLNNLDYTKRIIVMEAHRSENLGAPMEAICRAVSRLLDDNPDTRLVWPVHLNPEVRKTAFAILGNHPRALLTEPVSVVDLDTLISRSYMVLTDSGGLQEETPSMHKPTVVLRNVTERPEGVETGA